MAGSGREISGAHLSLSRVSYGNSGDREVPGDVLGEGHSHTGAVKHLGIPGMGKG